MSGWSRPHEPAKAAGGGAFAPAAYTTPGKVFSIALENGKMATIPYQMSPQT